jgi:hypothetical protein
LKQNPQGRTFLGNSGNIKDFDVRTDLNLALVWRLENLGLGNAVRIRDARIQTQQAEVQLLFLQDLIVTQVVQAMEGVQRGLQRYHIYKAGLFDASGNPTGTVYRSLRLNFVRIKGGQGLPLEVLDSTRRLSDVLQGYADSITDYDRSRYRLLVALGLPPQAILDPSCMPIPPASAPDAPPQSFPVPAVPTPVRTETGGHACGPNAPVVRGALAAPQDTPAEDGLDQVRGIPLPPLHHTGVQVAPWVP